MTDSHTIPRRRWPWLGLVLLFVLMAMGSAFTAVTLATPEANIIAGTVTSPDGGLPPTGTIVQLLSPHGALHGSAVVNGSGGFSLGPVPDGNYHLQAVAPLASGYTRSLPASILVMGQAVDAGTLALTNPSITGTVFEPDGSTPVSALVIVHKMGHQIQATLAPAGEVRLGGFLTGTYMIEAIPVSDAPFWRSTRVPVTVTSSVNQLVDLTLRPANVVGTVIDPTGAPVAGARVHVVGTSLPSHQADVTSATGFFAIGGLSDDDYFLVAEPPWYSGGLVVSEAILFSVPPAFTDVGNVALRSAPKIVTGKVETNTGVPVHNARVVANRLGYPGHQEASSDAQGRYSLRLGGGLWALTVRPTPDSVPPAWIYPHAPQLVHFDPDLQPEIKHVDFGVLTADSTVVGTITLPDGITAPPFTTTVGLRNNEGIGRQQVLAPGQSAFAIELPHGNYVLHINPQDPNYAGPAPLQVYAPISDTLDVGIISLLEKDATISGTVFDSEGSGVEGVEVIGWTGEHMGAQTRTNPDGTYLLNVAAGNWLIKPRVPASMPYVYSGRPITVSIASMGSVTGTDFILDDANNLVLGQLVDTQGAVVNVKGWASAAGSNGPVNGAPVEGGEFELYLPDGTFEVRVHLPAGSEWLAGKAQPVTVANSQTVTLSMPLLPQNAKIATALWEPRLELVPTGVKGQVTANNPSAWVSQAINPGNGTAVLGVSAGLWHLSYAVDPTSGYVALDHHKIVPLEAGQTAGVPLPVLHKDSVLEGTVFAPDGRPLPGAVVAADGLGGLLGQITLRTLTNENGEFRLAVPHGNYLLRAAHRGDPGWLNPIAKAFAAARNDIHRGIELRFRVADVTLSGVTSLAADPAVDGRVHIWAYSDDGAATHTVVPLGERYELGLLSSSRWHIGAVLETGSSFYAVRTVVHMGSANQLLDLVLQGPHAKPGPVVTTFEASEPQHLELSDGTQIFIPAGAMPVSGTVTLHATPIATLPHQHHARLYKYGYAFVATDETGAAITSSFDQNVIIRFSYEERELRALGLRESHLKPAYYSTSTQSWTVPESYVVDTQNNYVTMQIDHFTEFSLLGSQVQEVFLPMVGG